VYPPLSRSASLTASSLSVFILAEDTPGTQVDRVLPTEVVTCAKNNTGDVLGCEEKIPYQYTPVYGSCQQVRLTWPLQMNTVVAPNGVIKTIEAQDEVFGCPTIVSPQFLKDVTIFTHMADTLPGPSGQPILWDHFQWITCTEVVANLNVTGCKVQQPPLPQAIPTINKP
jgi:hypothetical protein